MSMQDTLADMFTRIRNAQQAGHTNVSMPSSKLRSLWLRFSNLKATLLASSIVRLFALT